MKLSLQIRAAFRNDNKKNVLGSMSERKAEIKGEIANSDDDSQIKSLEAELKQLDKHQKAIEANVKQMIKDEKDESKKVRYHYFWTCVLMSEIKISIRIKRVELSTFEQIF